MDFNKACSLKVGDSFKYHKGKRATRWKVVDRDLSNVGLEKVLTIEGSSYATGRKKTFVVALDFREHSYIEDTNDLKAYVPFNCSSL